MQSQPPPNDWYLLDRGIKYGPVSWNTILKWVEEGRLSSESHVWREGMGYWVPLSNYVKITTPGEEEARALIPSRYDAMVWGSMGVFVLGIIAVIKSIFLGIPVLILSNALAIAGVYLDIKKRKRTTVGTIGNVFAIIWIVIQLLITMFLVYVFVFASR